MRTAREMADQANDLKEEPGIGWGNPLQFNAYAKFHYFTDGRSLCDKWSRFPNSFDLEECDDNHSGNCATCKERKGAKG